ncbi:MULTISPECIES: amidohydrolase family protein [unclassified Rhizobium]|uniref:amidohydrolase family protein n=1 Tax=unclassified Rhizobium TaxID=2613769 RepID=UPI0016075888|nr:MULTISPECIES: amidohydrolase family protein [unclassified Rhizobium]MBB3541422.1 cytosine deaminase [Rhizobium sp. BK399]MCS3740146.1 cytosine deaminase [Rhizobium sp. BK661]MCS4091904.1 cytosine deaminase [Rhizobium sp. BK176]
MHDLLLRNARPMAGESCDILIRHGKIAGLGSYRPEDGMAVEDGNGAIVVPGLIDAHTHLDKTTWGMPWHVNDRPAILQGRIDFERENRQEIGIDAHRQSMRHAIGLAANGASHIRSHVDIDTRHGLSLVEGVWRTRDALRDIIDIEIVAFPQSGVMVMPGTVDLLDEALRQGCEVLGGIDPCGIDRDPKGQLDILFALAVRHGVPIDIHLHEAADLGAFTMELIFERIRANGMEGKVAISHAFALGMNDYVRVGKLIEEIARLDVAILTTGAPSVNVPSIMRLKEAGVRVGGGCDGIRDTWGPWGQPDMLDRAKVIGMKNGLRTDQELAHVLNVVSKGGADVMRIDGYGLDVGCNADFTLLTGETLAHAVVDTAPRPLVVKNGRVVARKGKAIVEMP